MSTAIKAPGIKNIDFMNEHLMIIHLDNERTFIVPLAQFDAIKKLSKMERLEFEIIDDSYLSFLAIDHIYSINELLGI